ncbi:MAG TPA: hypothetical protein VJ808_09380 [Gemmatimonadales bacterium]|nr:hypothetical protein [Gemmatimonadales bacterium]
MSQTVRVFVNAVAVDLPAGTDVAAAVRALDPALAALISSGAAYVTDARGIEISSETSLAAGAILRVIARARRSENADADA